MWLIETPVMTRLFQLTVMFIAIKIMFHKYLELYAGQEIMDLNEYVDQHMIESEQGHIIHNEIRRQVDHMMRLELQRLKEVN